MHCPSGCTYPLGRTRCDSSGSCTVLRAARTHWDALGVIPLGRALFFGLHVPTGAHCHSIRMWVQKGVNAVVCFRILFFCLWGFPEVSRGSRGRQGESECQFDSEWYTFYCVCLRSLLVCFVIAFVFWLFSEVSGSSLDFLSPRALEKSRRDIFCSFSVSGGSFPCRPHS